MKPVTNDYNVLINDDDSIASHDSINSSNASVDIQIKSQPVEMCKCFVEILLFIFVFIIFLVVLAIVTQQDSFVYWARR